VQDEDEEDKIRQINDLSALKLINEELLSANSALKK
jgi:hypothetical protein